MAYDVSLTSERWEEIVNIQDENKQGRELRKYVYELEHKVSSYEYELRELRRENTNMKKDILSIKVVKDAISNAKSEAYSECNTDWSGLQGGF